MSCAGRNEANLTKNVQNQSNNAELNTNILTPSATETDRPRYYDYFK
jgi:hypothetical protein